MGLHRVQRIAKQADEHGIEPFRTSQEAQQGLGTAVSVGLGDGNSVAARASNERLAIEGSARLRCGTVENVRCQNVSESRERALSRSRRRGFAFPDLECLALLSNRSHGVISRLNWLDRGLVRALVDEFCV